MSDGGFFFDLPAMGQFSVRERQRYHLLGFFCYLKRLFWPCRINAFFRQVEIPVLIAAELSIETSKFSTSN